MPRIRAVIFDMDGTLVQYEESPFLSSWDAIGYAAGLKPEWDRLMAYYLPRRGQYWEWLEANARLLRGVPVEQICKKVLPPPYSPGARAAIRALKPRYQVGLLTSGVDLVADHIRQDLGLDFAVANKLVVRDGRFSGACERVVHLWRKHEVLLGLCRQRKLQPREICFVGDHLNDVPALELAGLAVAYRPKDPQLARVADAVIDDLRELPGLLIDRRASDG